MLNTPLFLGRAVPYDVNHIDDEVIDDVKWLLQAQGCSNYLPEWEVVKVEGEWYHIDGSKLDPAIDFSPDAEFEEQRLVPYSLLSWWNGEATPPKLSGLNNHHELLQECLGTLFSAPAHKVGLTFERNSLRAIANSDSFCHDLRMAQAFFKSLKDHGGTIQIVDIDDMNHYTFYEPRKKSRFNYPSSLDPRMLMAGAALIAEDFEVKINPVLCTLQKRAGKPAVMIKQGMAHWYRIISFQGLAEITHSEYAKPTEHQKFNLRDAFQTIFMSKGLYPLSKVGELHIKCMSRSEAVNLFESDWEPFHITWFRIDDRCDLGNWKREFGNRKSGRLYGTESGRDQHLEEVAFTMCFYPNMGSDWHYREHVMTATDYLLYLKQPNWWYFFILVLSPSHFREYSTYSSRNRPAIKYGGHLAPVGLILEALQDAVKSWEGIVNHLACLVNQRGGDFRSGPARSTSI